MSEMQHKNSACGRGWYAFFYVRIILSASSTLKSVHFTAVSPTAVSTAFGPQYSAT